MASKNIKRQSKALDTWLDAVEQMLDERQRLRAWIKTEGERTDTCTLAVLGEVCENCRCGKATK
jgi:hypothetical protein